MHRLRRGAAAEARRLLRVLFLRLGTMSADSGRAFGRRRPGFLLYLTGKRSPMIHKACPLATMQELVRHWATDHDWRKVEARLNAQPAIQHPGYRCIFWLVW